MPYRASRLLICLFLLGLFGSLVPAAGLPRTALAAPIQGPLPIDAAASALTPASARASAPPPKLNVIPQSIPAHAPIPVPAAAAASFAALPLVFLPNAGQTDRRVRFETHAMGGTIFFGPAEMVFALPTQGNAAKPDRPTRADRQQRRTAPQQPVRQKSGAVRIQFQGANATPSVNGADRLPGVVNDLRGKNKAAWQRNIPTYAGIIYQQLYSGVDLRVDGAHGQLKSTWLVAAGADPSQIRWRYQGADQIQLDARTGDLHITLPTPPISGTTVTTPSVLIEHAPRAWQMMGGQRRSVSARFVVAASGAVRLSLGTYDHSQPLQIDPAFSYQATLGGTGNEFSSGIAVDAAGNTYIAGSTDSTDFPVANAAQSTLAGETDAFITKISPDGQTILYSTYLGGSGYDYATGIAVDDQGQVSVTGISNSVPWNSPATPFPTVGDAYQPTAPSIVSRAAFVSQLDASGALIYSSFFTGSVPEADEDIDIAIHRTPSGSTDTYLVGTRFISGTYVGSMYIPGYWLSFIARLTLADGSSALQSFYTNSNDAILTGIAVDHDGNAYATGYNNDTHVFVVKVDPSGSVVYTKAFGGTQGDYGDAITVDPEGRVAVTGLTFSPDFPVTSTAYRQQCGTDGLCNTETFDYYSLTHGDTFVTALTAVGDIRYSTYLGAGGGIRQSSGYGIGTDTLDAIYVTGDGGDFVPTKDALPDASAVGAYLAKFDPMQAGYDSLVYSTGLLADGTDSIGAALAITDDGLATVVGSLNVTETISSTTTDAFIVQVAPSGPSIPARLVSVPEGNTCGCPVGAHPNPHLSVGGPIDTRSGNVWLQVTDLALTSAGPALAWTRSYASQATDDLTGTLGFGWQHPYAARILAPTMLGGTPDQVTVFTAAGNRQVFADDGDGLYTAEPGVYSTLVSDSSVYTQTLRNQSQNIFDASTGRLLRMRDPQGRELTLSYDPTTQMLTRVADAADATRFLTMTYGVDGRMASLSDGIRTVQYTHDGNGDLTVVQDVMGRDTTYTYDQHLLTEVQNALGQTTEQTDYDEYTPTGRATHQTLQDGRTLDLQYLAATTVVTTTGIDGHRDVQEFVYAHSSAIAGVRTNGQAVFASRFDDSFSPQAFADGNGQVQRVQSDANGLPLSSTDALGQTREATYDDQNHPLSVTDSQGVSTLLRYDAFGHVISSTLGVTLDSPLRATTLYTYTYDFPTPGDSRLLEQSGPEGVVMHYDYDTRGQVITTTVGYGTALAQVSTLGYDALGRVITSTVGVGTAFQRMDVTQYNADNTLAARIQNYQNGVFDPAHPDQDLITSYGYDLAGRQVWTRDALGHYAATHYSDGGQVDWSVRNLTPLSFDTQGQPIFQVFSPAQPDANVATLYGYDGLGRTTLVTQTGILDGTFNPSTLQFSDATARVTKTEYDALSRPITTTLDYGGLNVQVLTYYDGAGNVIWQRDALGRWTKTDYDALSRPITTTVNYEDGNPLTGAQDADILSVTHYDAAGRVDRQIANAVDGIFTVTDAITDRVTLAEYDTLGRTVATTVNYDPPTLGTRTDTNRRTVTDYDPITGRVLGTQDALGRWISQQYDQLGRVTTTIQNCRDAGGTAVAQDCAAYSDTFTDRNVASSTHYDALGRAFETVDAQGHVGHMTFDDVGHVVSAQQNYVASAPTTAITNVTTLMAYDPLGRTTVMTDAVGKATYSTYDALGHTSVVTDSAGQATHYGYDGTGALRWSRRADGQLTAYQLDGLGRVTATIVNYQNGVVDSSDASDQDVTSQTAYDAAGRQIQAIDPDGRVTQFAYDNQDRLIAVTENAATGTCPNAPCNVVTQYQYDRVGNRTAIVDALGHTRTFTYDAADQPTSATDALNQSTTWEYDAAGQPTVQHDPRGSDDDLQYTYDDLGRLTATTATNLGTISAAFDPLGRRVLLEDGTGTTNFTYDPLGRVTQVQAPDTGTVGYSYNALGQRTALTYPDSTTVQYAYGSDGRLQSVTQGMRELASYTYDSVGRLQTVSRANGTTTTTTYDDADRVRDLRTQVGDTDTSRFAYQVDRSGLRTVVTETVPLSPTGGLMMMAGSMQARSAAAEPESQSARPIRSAPRLPLAFVANQGQSNAAVRYQARALGGGVFFTQTGVTLALPSSARRATKRQKPTSKQQKQAPESARAKAGPPAVVRLHYTGANPSPTIEGADQLPGVVNDLRGKARARQRTHVTTYAGVVYRQLYPGIDVRYDGADGQLKSTYTVAPGADPTQIRWRYDGARAVALDTDGNLVLTLPVSSTTTITATDRTLTEQAPRAWQIINGRQVAVDVRFALGAGRQVRFTLGTYDHSQPLIIDPALIYSVLVGGSDDEYASSIAQDSTGAVYVTGSTISYDYPIVGAAQSDLSGSNDVFVTKLSANGATVVYSTYLGGSDYDFGSGIAVNSSGEAIVTGETDSTDFPTVNALVSSCPLGSYGSYTYCASTFVTKLSADGSTLVYSTYLGGSGYTVGHGIAVDSAGAAYVTGETQTTDFPTITAMQGTCAGGYYTDCDDVFVTKVISDGSALAYSTYLGGSSGEIGNAIAVDSSGAAYITGATSSTDFPTTNPLQSTCGGDPDPCSDAFVTKLSADGQTRVYSTYLGGSGGESGNGIAVDSSGAAYVAGAVGYVYDGEFSSGDPSTFPTTPGARQTTTGGQQDAFAFKLNPAGTTLIYSTFIGGQYDDSAAGVAVDGSGIAYVTGQTSSADFPTAQTLGPCLLTAYGGCADAFVAAVSADGSQFVYNTYLGGSEYDQGTGVVADSAGVATVVGTTSATDVLTTTAMIGTMGGYGTAFVMRLGPTATAAVAASRVITYTYDGLARLTQATEQPGLRTTYVYDLAGNRTQVKVNDQITAVRAYNAANQVVGWQYDAAGNLLSDGETASTYDSLNRTLTTTAAGQARTMRYNGDGTLVGQLANGDAITYTQDLASPLSQILQLTQGGATTDYLYGRDRLAFVAGSTRTWYGTDALGSVRQTLTDSGVPLSVVNYDPWGTSESGTVPTFGFTGELQDAATGLVNLRARWYDPTHSTFTSRDTFAGMPETPYSQHLYAYVLGNPLLYTDPAGTYAVCDDGERCPSSHPTTNPSSQGRKGTTSVNGSALSSIVGVGSLPLLGEGGGGVTLIGKGVSGALACAASAPCIILVGAAGELLYFTVLPNAAEHRQDLARGAAYVWDTAPKGLAVCTQWLAGVLGAQQGNNEQQAAIPASSDVGGNTAGPGGLDPNDPDDMGNGPGSAAHKAQRWAEYQARGGKWSYDQWSNVYEANMIRARAANASVDAYWRQLGWGRKEVEVEVEGVIRRLDIADEATMRGVEFKTGYQTATQENLWEVARDEILRQNGWDIKWVFRDRASAPLLQALKNAGIPVESLP